MIQTRTAPTWNSTQETSESPLLRLVIDDVDVDVRGPAKVLTILSSIYRRHLRNGQRDGEMIRGLRMRIDGPQAVTNGDVRATSTHGESLSSAAHAHSACERIIFGVGDCTNRQVVRAAALEREGRALLIGGRPRSGKSTLAINLLARGWKLLADDIVLLSADGMRAIAYQALVTLSVRSTPHVPALFRGTLERSRWYTSDNGSDLRYFEIDPALALGKNVWSEIAELDAIVLLDNETSETRVRTIDAREVQPCFDASALRIHTLPPHVRVGVTAPNRAVRSAESVEAWFDAHAM